MHCGTLGVEFSHCGFTRLVSGLTVRVPCGITTAVVPSQKLAAAPGRIAQPSTPWWKHVLFWSEWFSFPTKVRLTVAGLMLVPVLILSGFLLRRSVLFLLATVGLLASSLLGAEALLQDPANANGGVITGETTARKGTGKDYEPAFDQPLRDGAEFTILSETADWTFGHFEGIGDGWVRNEFVAR